MKNLIFSYEEFSSAARKTISEGCVLLENRNNALPLFPGTKIAFFGRTQMNCFKSGLGSGGLVNAPYVIGIYEALDKAGLILDKKIRSVYESWTKQNPFDIGDGWSNHPWFQKDMPLDKELVETASEENDAAVILIGRTAGEDKDNSNEKGSFLLTDEEESMLSIVCSCFSRTIVLLNVGNIIDMTWVKKYKPSAVMYVWQGGQEMGNGIADVICGTVSPSGHLTDTIAEKISDYPSDTSFGNEDVCIYSEDIYVGYRYFETVNSEKVLYPFGYGLSYTDFEHIPESIKITDNKIVIHHKIKNIGSFTGKEVVQFYVSAPQGLLGKPKKILCAFIKTPDLKPDEIYRSETTIPFDIIASYDDSGVTGHPYCYILEKGEYSFHAGNNVRSTVFVGSFSPSENMIISEHEQCCAPVRSYQRFCFSDGSFKYENTPLRKYNMHSKRAERLPVGINQTEFKNYVLKDVYEKKCSMNDFIAQFSKEDLLCIVRGEGMSSPRVTPGTAGCIGGVSDRLVNLYALPSVCCADGPSGIRMDCGNIAFSMPSGTCQGCTWNEELITKLYSFEGLEMRKYQVDNLLGPGMNIHRHPLCGRNFEYFSEDPLLTGRIASAQLKGLSQSGVTGTIKHYSCNNQEFSRRKVDAVVSERALREIYLKGFEIAVKEGNARSVMTTYNPLNGCYTASEYDLVTTILRKEWGFDGIVMTDWWAMGSEDNKDPSTSNVASMVRAQNDLFMVANNPSVNSGNDDLEESLENGTLSVAELQRSAANICRFLIETPAFRRISGLETEMDKELRLLRSNDKEILLTINEILLGEESIIDGSQISTGSGKNNLWQMKLEKHGQYEISITCRASANLPDTAQLPLSLFVDSQLRGSWTLNGGEKEWKTFTVTTREIRRRYIFYTKLFFAVGGLEVKEIRIVRTKTFD